MRSIFLPLTFILLCAGCGESNQVMSATFSTMDNCISSIKRNTGSNLNILVDKPGNISGKLSNGQHFSCQTKTTGTKGIHVEGWYTVAK